MIDSKPIKIDDYTDLSERVYEAIKANIVSCRFPPGSRLQIVKLSKDLAVSRSPVTDALNKLAGERLVSEVPRKGYYVATLDLDDYASLLQARQVVESGAAELGLSAINASLVAQLRHYIEIQLSTIDSRGLHTDYETWLKADASFHLATVDVAGNRHLTEYHSRLQTHFHMARIYYATSVGHRPVSETIEEHTAIADAFERKDLAEIRAAISRHIEQLRIFFYDRIR